MLMILGATFTGMAAWLILAGSGVRATDGGWARAAHVVCGWLTVQGLLAPQGEFTFGVPQFSLLFSPILICLAAGLGLVAFRLVHGRWWTVGFVVVNFVIQATGFLDFGSEDEGPVDTRFAATLLVSAVVVEAVARLLGTERRLRFAVVSGLGIGTLGLAGEWVWNADAWQPWTDALLPEVVVLGVVAAVGASVLGLAFGQAVAGETGDGVKASGVSGPVLALAGLACLAVLLFPMRRPIGDVEATLRLEPAPGGTAFVTATLTPPDAAEDAYWFQATAWQGGGLELAEMVPTGQPGEFRSDQAIPVDGLWKSLLRLHRGAEMMAAPIYLPADPEIGEADGAGDRPHGAVRVGAALPPTGDSARQRLAVAGHPPDARARVRALGGCVRSRRAPPQRAAARRRRGGTVRGGCCRGGSWASSSSDASVMRRTARSKASSVRSDVFWTPLILRTY